MTPFYTPKFRSVPLLAMVGLIAALPSARCQPLSFTIDSNLSALTFSIDIPSLSTGYSATAHFGGSILADIGDQSITFRPQSILNGIDDGDYPPGPGGAPGTAPGHLGGETSLGGLGGVQFAARETATQVSGVAPITSTVSSGPQRSFTFDPTSLFVGAVGGRVDYRGTGLLESILGGGSFDYADFVPMSMNSSASAGTLVETTSGAIRNHTMTLPIQISQTIPISEDLPIEITASVSGQVVASTSKALVLEGRQSPLASRSQIDAPLDFHFDVTSGLVMQLDLCVLGDIPPAETLRTWETTAENLWSHKFDISFGQESYPIQLSVNFVPRTDPGLDAFVTVIGAGMPNPTNFDRSAVSSGNMWMILENDRPNELIFTHEVGHLIGAFDEYIGGYLDPITPITNDPDSIMGNIEGKPRDRHYERAIDWLMSGLQGPVVLTQSPLYGPPPDRFISPHEIEQPPSIPEASSLLMVFTVLGLWTGGRWVIHRRACPIIRTKR